MEMEKHKLTHETLHEMLLRKLTDLTNDDGDIVYPGPGDPLTRTGSNLRELLSYLMAGEGNKCVDVPIIRDILIRDYKIPMSLLYVAKQKWKTIK